MSSSSSSASSASSASTIAASTAVDLSRYRKGSIVQMRLVNFMTYENDVVRPGPRVNIILGANGSGKSSILCAVYLGLGGHPRGLGRNKKASSFVRNPDRGEDIRKATIELFLMDTPGQNFKTLRIKRTIFRDREKSKWEMGFDFGLQSRKRLTEVSFKEIEQLVTGYGIFVGNKVQFLPQQVVGEFTKMGPKDLLVETQLACIGREYWQKQKHICELTKAFADRDGRRADLRKDQARSQAELAELTQQLETFRKRQEVQDKMIVQQQKLPWRELNEAEAPYKEALQVKKKAKADYKAARATLEPLENDLADAQAAAASGKTRVKTYQKMSKKASDAMNRHADAIDDLIQKCGDVEDEVTQERDTAVTARKKANLYKEKMPVLVQARDEQESPEDVVQLVQQARDSHRAARSRLQDLDRQISEASNDRDKARHELERAQVRIQKLQSPRSLRQQQLARDGPKAAHARRFLQALDSERRAGRIQGQYFGPLIVEIECTNPNFADAVESSIPFGQKYNFIFTNESDMVLMRQRHRPLYDKIGLTVEQPGNLLTAESVANRRPLRPQFMASLKSRGVIGYLDQFVKCHPIVRSVLYRKCYLEKRLLADARLAEPRAANPLLFDMLKTTKSVITLLAGDTMHTASKARYGPPVPMVDSRDIRQAKYLSISVDTSAAQSVKQAAEQAQARLGQLEQQLAAWGRERKPLAASRAEAEALVKQLKKRKNEALARKTQVEMLKRRVQKQLQIADDAEKKSRLASAHIAEARRQLWAAHTAGPLAQRAKSLFEHAKARISTSAAQSHERRARDRLQQGKAALKDIEDEFKRAVATFNEIKAKCKAIRERAEAAVAPHKSPPPELKKEFDKFPNGTEELRTAIAALREQLRLLPPTDPDVEERHAQVTANLERLEAHLSDFDNQSTAEEQQIQAEFDDWHSKVQHVVEQISFDFSGFFEQMGCQGLVELYADVRDFENAGIHIKVKFRDAQPMALLSHKNQSGGECAISTLMYLLAIQQVRKSPIRMVDEINQGMDSENERAGIEQILKTSCGASGSQFFMLTPKLLMNLPYTEDVMVHTVITPNAPDSRSWNEAFPDFIETLGRKRRRVSAPR